MTSSCVWADTECFVVTRLGYRWALTLAPPYVQLIWTLTGCQTCWSEHLCFLRSEMRVKSQSISTEETWVCTGDDLVRDEAVGPRRVALMSFQHCMVKLDVSDRGALDVSSRAWSHGKLIWYHGFPDTSPHSSQSCESFKEVWESFWFYVETWWYLWLYMNLMPKPSKSQQLWLSVLRSH